MFQNLDSSVSHFMLDHDITIIEFLDSVTPKYLESNDITTTKFLDAVLDNFREQNDISVTKFMDDTNVSNMYDLGHDNYGYDNYSPQGNPLSAGPRNWRSYRRDALDDEWMSNGDWEHARELDHRWLDELEHHY